MRQLLFTFLLLVPLLSDAQECVSGDCIDGYGTYTYANGAKYVGEFKDDKKHGQGTFTYASGSKYVGKFKDDKKHGQGTMTYSDGTKYVGKHKDGFEHGQGTLTWPDGEKYVGKWKKGRKYVGEYNDGKEHGQGTMTYANGDQYVGGWKDGKKHGQGTMKWADGDKYVGGYKNDKRHGQGTWTYANGEKEDEEWGLEDSVFMIVEYMPAFPGCEHLLGEELKQCTERGVITRVMTSVKYPAIAEEGMIQGTVFVYYEIDRKGEVVNVDVIRGVHPSLDKAAKAAVENLPDHSPGEQRGRPVRVRYTIPVRFTIK